MESGIRISYDRDETSFCGLRICTKATRQLNLLNPMDQWICGPVDGTVR